MRDFDKGYLYGVFAASVAFVVWEFARHAPKPITTKLVVLDRRDMADNADHRTPDRMAGSSEERANP